MVLLIKKSFFFLKSGRWQYFNVYKCKHMSEIVTSIIFKLTRFWFKKLVYCSLYTVDLTNVRCLHYQVVFLLKLPVLQRELECAAIRKFTLQSRCSYVRGDAMCVLILNINSKVHTLIACHVVNKYQLSCNATFMIIAVSTFLFLFPVKNT